MSLGRSQALFAATLLYAAAVSVYIAISTVATIEPAQKAAADFAVYFGLTNFGYMFGAALCFMLLVVLLDFLTGRTQQALVALSIGLAAAATYQAAVQVAFIQSYTYYKSSMTPDKPTPATETR